ncbi:MAG: DUF2203 domain-containing protein [Acidobacteriota bacterium]
MEKRFFTVVQVQALLPTLKELVGQVVQISEKLEGQRAVVEKFAESSANDSGGREGGPYLKGLTLMHDSLEQIRSMGCMVKSVELGLIDFPHLKDGREVYLCWKYGEEDILYWHEVDQGLMGRIPLAEE